MTLSSRLLLPLLPVVAGVTIAYGGWALAQTQRVYTEEARRETRAYAIALGVGLEGAFRDPGLRDVQAIINRISQDPKVYGILVYDASGEVLFVSSALAPGAHAAHPALARALSEGALIGAERSLGEQRVYSVVHPIRGSDGRVLGVFEVAQPLSALNEQKARVRERFVLNTLTLLALVTVVILWLVRRFIGRPLANLVGGVRALGRGEMTHRIAVDPAGGELADLGREFNVMADRIEAGHAALLREAEERVGMERRLRQAEKLAAVGSLAAGLAHEIAAPLHVIRGRAELLQKRDPPAEARKRNLGIIVEQIGRITGIIHNLLDFARRREPQIGRVDLGRVVAEVVEFLEPEFDRAGVEVAREGAVAAWVDGDAHLLQQVLINLFMNAMQAMEATAGERRIRIRLQEHGGRAVVEVEDSGPGIAPEIVPQLFEPFFTTHPDGRGTGLGLAVARGIVEEHGGTIEAGAAASGGACFRVEVPLAAEVDAHG